MKFQFCGRFIDTEDAGALFPRYAAEFNLLIGYNHTVLDNSDPALSPGGPNLLQRCVAGEQDTDQRVTSGDATRLFIRRLGLVSDALEVFQRLRSAPLECAHDTIALQLEEAYWNYYHAYTLAVPVRNLVLACAQEGDGIIGELEHVRTRMLRAPSFDDACMEHALLRTRFVALGAHRYLSNDHVAAGEFIADYFLIQRAVALDIREAGRLRPVMRSLVYELEEREARRMLFVTRAYQHVLDPLAILAAVSDAPLGSADFLSVGDPRQLLVYARQRGASDRNLLEAST